MVSCGWPKTKSLLLRFNQTFYGYSLQQYSQMLLLQILNYKHLGKKMKFNIVAERTWKFANILQMINRREMDWNLGLGPVGSSRTCGMPLTSWCSMSFWGHSVYLSLNGWTLGNGWPYRETEWNLGLVDTRRTYMGYHWPNTLQSHFGSFSVLVSNWHLTKNGWS